ncbi:beta-galactoside-binding lectin-like [Gadus morhua]|uniref:beta-galactoside-binding lectin-like n=1 Tax=Gadus morhua TaxID=8049 RepID=UPI0011B3B565|nr:beta-galactoside-binding lectin-like [Gadus morhua]
MLNQSDDNMAEMMVKNMPLKLGHTLTVTGIPNAALVKDSFEFYISSGDDLALYMDVRFNRYQDMRQVVCNSHQAGRWGAEVHQGGFPFKYNELFKFTITLTCQEFLVLLSDGSEIHFPNRLGATEYKDFSSDKGVLIHSFEIN